MRSMELSGMSDRNCRPSWWNSFTDMSIPDNQSAAHSTLRPLICFLIPSSIQHLKFPSCPHLLRTLYDPLRIHPYTNQLYQCYLHFWFSYWLARGRGDAGVPWELSAIDEVGSKLCVSDFLGFVDLHMIACVFTLVFIGFNAFL